MDIEDFTDIYDKIPYYVDPLLYPSYRDFSNAVSRAFGYQTCNLLKEFVREIWDQYWDEIDLDGSLRDYYISLT